VNNNNNNKMFVLFSAIIISYTMSRPSVYYPAFLCSPVIAFVPHTSQLWRTTWLSGMSCITTLMTFLVGLNTLSLGLWVRCSTDWAGPLKIELELIDNTRTNQTLNTWWTYVQSTIEFPLKRNTIYNKIYIENRNYANIYFLP